MKLVKIDVSFQFKSEKDKFENYVSFSNSEIYTRIFDNFNRKIEPKESKLCVVTNQPAKYFDPLTKQHYSSIESFKIIRERYFQKEEDGLLFRIQTLSDLASQKKEKLKKILLSVDNSHLNVTSTKNMMNMIHKYGILKNDNIEMEKKVIGRKREQFNIRPDL